MSLSESEFIGCSIDGLRDKLFAYNTKRYYDFRFFISDIVLQNELFSKPLVGEKAENSRINAGLPWPKEALFPRQFNNLKRIPIPLCWRQLIDCGDQNVKLYDQEVTRLLAYHFAERISYENQTGKKEFCLAIPDGLSDLAQERLYKSLKQQSQVSGDGLMLVRRSIASALAWLDETQLEIKDLSAEDHLLVVYLGPDAFESTVLRLKLENTADGKKFIIPVRDYRRQSRVSFYSGFDVVDSFVSNTLNIKDFQARWRLLTGISDLWCLLNRRNIERQHSEVFYSDESWNIWNCDPSWKDTIWQSKVVRTDLLKGIGMSYCENGEGKAWREYLKTFISDEPLQNIKLRGIILTGSLLSGETSFFADHLLSILQKQNPEARLVDVPKKDSVWLPNPSVDPLASGTAIFAYRTHKSLPTYFDVIPQISIYVRTRLGLTWKPFLEQDNIEVSGGRLHEFKLSKQFKLKRGSPKVECYLQRGEKIKKAVFSFSSAPKEDITLDVQLRLAASKGLAQVELVPYEDYFLFDGQKIRLDFLSMEELHKDDLPKEKSGYPYIGKIKIDLEDRNLRSDDFKYIWERYEGIKNFSNNSAVEILQSLRQFINRPKGVLEEGIIWAYYPLVDQKGKAGSEIGNSLILKISKRMGANFKELLSFIEYTRLGITRDLACKSIRHLFNCSTWLNGAAPKEILNYVRLGLKNISFGDYKSNCGIFIPTIVRGSGRVITEREDFNLLLVACEKEVEKRRNMLIRNHSVQIERSGIFPSYWPRVISQVLAFHEYCADEISDSTAYKLANWAEDNIRILIQKDTFNKPRFFWNITLMLYLLRVRIRLPNFLGPKDEENHKRLLHTLQNAKKFCQKQRRALPLKYLEQVISLESHLLEVGTGHVPVDYFQDEEEEEE